MRTSADMPIQETDCGRIAALRALTELKNLYRPLFGQLRTEPGRDLDESDCLLELQSFLQWKAKEDGVDITHHAAWEAWFDNQAPVPCEQRDVGYARLQEGRDGQRGGW